MLPTASFAPPAVVQRRTKTYRRPPEIVGVSGSFSATVVVGTSTSPKRPTVFSLPAKISVTSKETVYCIKRIAPPEGNEPKTLLARLSHSVLDRPVLSDGPCFSQHALPPIHHGCFATDVCMNGRVSSYMREGWSDVFSSACNCLFERTLCADDSWQQPPSRSAPSCSKQRALISVPTAEGGR